MSEEESDDELPAISVNSSASNLIETAMPSALEVAQQRERELRTAREVRERRRWHEQREAGAGEADAASVTRLAHSDSSGSEGEAALAAAVRALQVHAPAAPRAVPALSARARTARLLAALAACAAAEDGGGDASRGGDASCGVRMLADHAHLLETAPPHTAANVTHQMILGVCGALASESGMAGGEQAVCVASWLCVLAAPAAAPGRAAGRLARRALHALLDTYAGTEQVWRVARLVSCAVGECGVAGAAGARARLEAGDAARGGGAGGADLLAALLYRRALAALLAPRGADPAPDRDTYMLSCSRVEEGRAAVSVRELAELVCAPAGLGPGALPTDARCVLAQLAGRVMAAASAREGAERACVLSALAHLTGPRARHNPDQFKLAVGKLQLLFHSSAAPALPANSDSDAR